MLTAFGGCVRHVSFQSQLLLVVQGYCVVNIGRRAFESRRHPTSLNPIYICPATLYKLFLFHTSQFLRYFYLQPTNVTV